MFYFALMPTGKIIRQAGFFSLGKANELKVKTFLSIYLLYLDYSKNVDGPTQDFTRKKTKKKRYRFSKRLTT